MKTTLALISFLLLATPASAQSRLFGVQADVGVPDGAAASLAVSPFLPWLDAQVGIATNVAGLGWRIGLTIDPIDWALSPSLTTEYGSYSGVDLSMFGDDLPGLSYSYFDNQLGLEIGSRNCFRFFIRGGFAWINVETDGIQRFLDRKSQGEVVITSTEPTLRGWIPTAKLGIKWMIW